MTRTSFLEGILPSTVTNITETNNSSLQVFKNKPKDIKYIKRITREKINVYGAPIRYFPMDLNSNNDTHTYDFDNSLGDHEHIKFLEPFMMVGTWTPQEYQMELSKFGLMMPAGSDQQLFIHVDEIDERLGRKPQIGDILETLNDTIRYRVSDVYYGHGNLWENIFTMITLTKTVRDNSTEQLDEFDTNYKDTYTNLEKTLNLMDGSEEHTSNQNIKKERKKTTSFSKKSPVVKETLKKPDKRSIDTGLDVMTMTL